MIEVTKSSFCKIIICVCVILIEILIFTQHTLASPMESVGSKLLRRWGLNWEGFWSTEWGTLILWREREREKEKMTLYNNYSSIVLRHYLHQIHLPPYSTSLPTNPSLHHPHSSPVHLPPYLILYLFAVVVLSSQAGQTLLLLVWPREEELRRTGNKRSFNMYEFTPT